MDLDWDQFLKMSEDALQEPCEAVMDMPGSNSTLESKQQKTQVDS